MNDRFTSRYAIYFTPDPTSALWRFGCKMLGYDAASGGNVPEFEHTVLDSELTKSQRREPARYGFHATLKPPFQLADRAMSGDLLKAARRFAAGQRPIVLSGLAVTRIGSFLALTPVETPRELGELADACVLEFEQFRASLTAADRARRLATHLTARQIGNLDRWGYPYVFEDFRFHMTLTGVLPATTLQSIASALEDLYRPFDGPVAIDSISVLEQKNRCANFRILQRFSFPQH
jgi:putative phosphonate metabolism protein